MSVIFLGFIWLSNIVFDKIWSGSCSIPVTNLDEVYNIPVQYDNTARINLKLVPPDKLALEGNKKLKVRNSSKNYDYYDTVSFTYPDKSFEYTNNIFLNIENDSTADSISFVVSKSDSKDLYWKQVFLSSILISDLNKFSEDTASFRIKKSNLVDENILENNDTLINGVLAYFNARKETLKLPECGANCLIFKSICDSFSLPCRIVALQGGDASFGGLDNNIGYPLHVVCEIYSSLNKKWYVLDPTYGSRFREKSSNEYMNAAEISNKYFFSDEKNIVQDSVLFTKQSIVGRDYYKFYENTFYKTGIKHGYLYKRLMQMFFGKFNYKVLHNTNDLTPVKNGFNYIGLKSIMYLINFIVYFNIILILLTKRLFSVKKPLKTI